MLDVGGRPHSLPKEELHIKTDLVGNVRSPMSKIHTKNFVPENYNYGLVIMTFFFGEDLK